MQRLSTPLESNASKSTRAIRTPSSLPISRTVPPFEKKRTVEPVEQSHDRSHHQAPSRVCGQREATHTQPCGCIVSRDEPPNRGWAGLATGSPRRVGAAVEHKRAPHITVQLVESCGRLRKSRSSFLADLFCIAGDFQRPPRSQRLVPALASLKPSKRPAPRRLHVLHPSPS